MKKRMKSAIIIITVLLLYSCNAFKGVFSDSIPSAFTVGGTVALPTATGGTTLATVIDINDDGVADGLDLDGNGIPEILYTILVENTSASLDLNGDGEADYYLVIGQDGKVLLLTSRSGGNNVTITQDATGNNTGFDTSGDTTAENSILTSIRNDSTAPTSTADSTGGTFTESQPVTLNCTDDVACNAISYTLDGTEPNFSGNGTLLVGSTGSVTITTTGTLKWVVRDANGNVQSSVSSLSFIASGGGTGGGGTGSGKCVFDTGVYGSCTFDT